MVFYDNMEQVLDFNNIEDLDVSEHYDSPSIYDDSCLCIPQDSLHEVFETFPSITSNKPISWRDLGIDLDFKDGETFLNFEPKLSHEFEFNIGTYEAEDQEGEEEDQEGEEEAKIITLKGIENYENNLIEPDVSQESEFNIGTYEVEDQEGEEEAKMVTLKGVENYENKLTKPAFFEPKLSQEFESNIGTYEAEDQEGEEEAKMVTLKGIENYENKLIEPAFFEPKLSQEFESNIGTYEAEDQEGEEFKMVTLKGTKNYENKLIEPAFFKPILSQEFESNIGTYEAEDQEGEEEAKMVTLKGIKNYKNKLIEPAFFEPKLSQEFESNIGTHKAGDQEGEEAKRVTLKALENYGNKLNEPFFSGFIKKKPRTKRYWQKYTKVLFGNHKTPKKCTHCRVERTPQWRAGPLGPKTLCNACGVRFKLGKLLPEYRPAASPEFDGKKYSNFHKRIMKRKAIEINNSCSARQVNSKKVLYDKYGIAMGKPDFYNKYFVH